MPEGINKIELELLVIIFIFYQVATRGLYHHQPREDNRSSSQVSEIGSQAGWVFDRRGQDSQMSDTQVTGGRRTR